MTDNEKIADTHAKIDLMFPMVQEIHKTVFIGENSLVTQVSKNTDMRETIHKRIWALTLAIVGAAIMIFRSLILDWLKRE